MYGRGGGSGDPITGPPDDYRLGGVQPVKLMLGTGTTAVEVWAKPLQPYESSTATPNALPQGVWTTIAQTTVQGKGVGTVYGEWAFGSTPIYTSAHQRIIRLTVNGRVEGTQDHGGDRVMAGAWSSTGTVPDVAFLHGDVLRIEAYADAANTNLRTVTSSLLRLTPNPI